MGNPKKKKPKTRSFLTTSQWAQLRTVWEMGQSTFKELADTWGMSESSLKKRSSKENWTRLGKVDEVKRKIEESTIDMFVRLGMPKEELIYLVIQGARGTKTIKNVKQIVKDKDGTPLKSKTGKPHVIEVTTQVEDNDITLRYRQDIAKLCGYYAAPKSPVESKDGDSDDTPNIPIVSHMKAVATNVSPSN